MRFLILLVTLLIASSCEDRVYLEFDRTDKRLVIEGTITDRNEPYYINLSYPTKYTYMPDPSDAQSRRATGAVVTVEDDMGNIYSFTENSPGSYVSDNTNFQGAIGRSYTLHIATTDGKIYKSRPEKMSAVATLDSLYYETEGDQYSLYIDLQDPPERGNYYQWKLRFGTRYSDWIDVAPDEYFNGNYLKRFKKDEGNYEDAKGREFSVEQLSISREKYKFLSLLNQQIDSEGTPFEAPASPIVGNVFNENDSSDYALGYFGASAISSKSITFE